MIKDIQHLFSNSNRVIQAIAINVAAFILVNILVAFFSIDALQYWVGVPSDLLTFVWHPWTLISYMFVHYDLMHLLSNMFILYLIGNVYASLVGSTNFWKLYILGGLAGGILFLITALIPGFYQQASSLIGASASVLAIVTYSALIAPNYEVNLLILGRIKLKWLALGIVILSTVLDLNMNTGGKVAHLGGIIAGYAFFKLRNISFAAKVPRGNRKSANKMYVVQQDSPAVKQEQIDSILDKISKSGYASLTQKEKDYLAQNHKN